MSGKWVQIHDANWKVGYLGGWCEGYVSMAWGYSKFIKDAKGAVIGTQGNGKGKTNYPAAVHEPDPRKGVGHWEAKKGNHTGKPPKGITVPVFFSLSKVPQGHVAIRLDDNYVASSSLPGYHSQGFLYKPDGIDNLVKDYTNSANGTCKYLGWSEYVAGVQVVKWVEDKPKPKPAPKPAEPPKPVEPPVTPPEPEKPVEEPPAIPNEPTEQEQLDPADLPPTPVEVETKPPLIDLTTPKGGVVGAIVSVIMLVALFVLGALTK